MTATPSSSQSSPSPARGRAAKRRPSRPGPLGVLAVAALLLAGTPGHAVSLHDLIILAARTSGTTLSIDPEIVAGLAAIPAGRPTAIENVLSLGPVLEQNGFVGHTLKLTPDVTVLALTTPQTWTLCRAAWLLEQGQAQAAHEELSAYLETATDLNSPCAALKADIETVVAQSRGMVQRQTQMLRAIEQFTRAAETYRVTHRRQEQALKRPAGATDVTRDWADKALAQAQEHIQEAVRLLDEMAKAVQEANTELAARFWEVYEQNFTIQAAYLLDHMVTSFHGLQRATARLEEAGLWAFSASDDDDSRREAVEPPELPPEVEELRQTLAAIGAQISANIRKATERLHSSPEQATHHFAVAFSLSSDSLLARVGTGYGMVSRHIRSLDALTHSFSTAQKNQRRRDLTRSLLALGKPDLLETADPEGERHTGTARGKGIRIGSANGLAVSASSGVLFPVSAQVLRAERTRRTSSRKQDDNYWNQILLHDYGKGYLDKGQVTFGDYGDKDTHMWMSAAEVMKWLSRAAPSDMKRNPSLRIDFHDLTNGKLGDSAGVTIAVSAYSDLNRIPVRQDVAMSGSIRGDGAVKRVGGAPEKVLGAHDCPGLQTVVLPRENEPDLAILPADVLCGLAVITADGIETYLNCATNALYHTKVLGALREAQVAVLVGEHAEATELLESLVSHHPELYSARRLLELYAVHGPAGR